MRYAEFISSPVNKINCMITGIEFQEKDFNENNIVKLTCGHIFSYDTILESYRVTNKKGRNYIGKRLCPYCLQDGGLLPIKDRIEPVKDIHFTNLNIVQNKKTFFCCGTIKSGVNKGNICNNKCKTNFVTYIYKPFYILSIDIDNNSLKKINISLKSRVWCGKHDKDKEKFLNSCDDLKKPYIFNKEFIKIGYRPKFGYIFINTENLYLLRNLISGLHTLNEYDNSLKISIDNKNNILCYFV